MNVAKTAKPCYTIFSLLFGKPGRTLFSSFPRCIYFNILYIYFIANL